MNIFNWDWNIKEQTGLAGADIIEFLGYTVDPKHSQTPLGDLRHHIFPDDMPVWEELIGSLCNLSINQFCERDIRFCHKDGHVFSLRFQLNKKENNVGSYSGYIIDVSDIRRQEAELIEENKILQFILNNIPHAVFWKDINSVYLGCNTAFSTVVGCKNINEIIGKDDYALAPEPAIVKGYQADDKEVIQSNKPKHAITEQVVDATGGKLWVDTSKIPLKDSGGNVFGVVGIFKDITVQEETRRELIRTNKLYNTLSKITSLLHTIPSKQELYNEVCRIIVDVGGFKLVWIGEPEGSLVKPLAYAGHPADYVQNIRITIDDTPEGYGPTGRSIRNGEKYVCNDFSKDPNTIPWKSLAEESGILSSANFPIKYSSRIIGSIIIYAGSVNYFGDREVALLEEIANTIGLGLDMIDNIQRQKDKEAELIEARDDWEKTFNAIPDFISILDNDYNIVRSNKAMLEKLNLATLDNSHIKCYSIMHGTSCPIDDCPHTMLLKDGKGHSVNIFEPSLNSYFNVTVSPIYDRDGKISGSVHIAKDITDQKIAEQRNTLLANIIENSNAFVGIGNYKTRTFVYLNNAGRNVLDIGPGEDITGLHIRDFISPDSLEMISTVAMPEVKEKGIWVGESQWVSRMGRVIPVIQVIMRHDGHHGEMEITSTTAIDISAIKKKEEELKKLTIELRSLSHHLQDIREEERKNIAKEIHDELGQNLSVLKMHSVWISSHVNPSDELMKVKLQQLTEIANDTIQKSRHLYNYLHPYMLEAEGLLKTLEWYCKNFTRHSGVKINFVSSFKTKDIFLKKQEISLMFFRVLQESLTNIIRHAHASHVDVVLKTEDGQIMLTITDDGRGFDINKVDTTLHHGLLGMRERVLAFDGRANINSSPGEGTTVLISVPILQDLFVVDEDET